MKKLSIILCTIAGLMVSCSADNKQFYVKNIYISETDNGYLMKLKYYDFYKEEETFQETVYTSDDLYTIAISAMNDSRYNFRLCEKVLASPEIFVKDCNKIIYMLNSIKISPNSDILCLAEGTDLTENMKNNYIVNPLHDISVSNGEVSALFPMITGKGACTGAIIVNNGGVTRVLSEQQYKVLNMLTNNSDSCYFTFRDNEMWAELSDIATAFDIKNGILGINISMNLKDYKGINNSLTGKKVLVELLEAEIANTVYDLYRDMSIKDIYNLHWYCVQAGQVCDSVRVEIAVK